MIDRLYTTLQVISTKDARGNLTPEEFNNLLNSVVEDKYEEYFFELNRNLNRENRGLGGNGFASVPEKIQERLRHYYTSQGILFELDNTYIAPADTRYVDSIYYGKREIEIVKSAVTFNLMTNSNFVAPRATRPIALETGRTYTVEPFNPLIPFKIFYLRNPRKAKWTYDPFTGLFNPTAPDFQDVDMHPSEEEDILRRLVVKAGINLNDQALAQYGAATETKEFTENAQS